MCLIFGHYCIELRIGKLDFHSGNYNLDVDTNKSETGNYNNEVRRDGWVGNRLDFNMGANCFIFLSQCWLLKDL